MNNTLTELKAAGVVVRVLIGANEKHVTVAAVGEDAVTLAVEGR
jgi:hypothetical protein